MIRAADLCACFRRALNEKWGYIWNGAGQTWTAAEQAAATRPMTVKYGARWIGKRVADCSGLFYWAFKTLGGSIYHGSNTIWKSYCTVRGEIADGPALRPGTAVFMRRKSNDNRHHIGLYVGGGVVIEARGTQYGVVESNAGDWDEWGELIGVDYGAEGGDKIMRTLRRGATGADVTTLQNALVSSGQSVAVDGKFGVQTKNAVIAFQQANGLNADGVCGPKTWAALGILGTQTGDDGAGDEVPAEAGEPVTRAEFDALAGVVNALRAEMDALKGAAE